VFYEEQAAGVGASGKVERTVFLAEWV